MAVTYITSGASRAVDIFTTLTVPWPTSGLLVNDVGLLIVEGDSMAGDPADTIPSISDTAWQLAATSTNSGSEDGTRVTIFMCRATSTSMSDVTVTFPTSGDHLLARIYTFRGVSTTVNPPIGPVATSFKDIGSNTWTSPAITTTVANSLVLCVVGRNTDFSSSQFTVGSNANLTGRTIINQIGTTINGGGGFVLISGTKVAPGDTGISTGVVLNNALNASITFAFLEPAGGTTYTIDAITTAFTVVSTNVGLVGAFVLGSIAATFNLVGIATGLSVSVTLNCATAAFSIDTVTAILLHLKLLALTQASFAVNNIDAILLHLKLLVLTQASLAVNNVNAILLHLKLLALTQGSFIVNGLNINLTSLNDKLLDLISTAFTVNATNLGITSSRLLSITQGLFSINSFTLNFELYLILNAVLQSFLAGTVNLVLSKGYDINAIAQAYILTPIITNVSRLYQLNALTNTYSVIGVLVDLIKIVAYVIQSIAAAFNIDYKTTELFKVYPINLTAQSFILNGIAAEIIRRYDINATTRAYLIGDSGVDYFSDRNIITLPLDLITSLQSNGDFFWYQTTNTIPVVKPRLTNRNQWILGRATHMGRRGL
jgi:hypothetical protein